MLNLTGNQINVDKNSDMIFPTLPTKLPKIKKMVILRIKRGEGIEFILYITGGNVNCCIFSGV
jgi:hypothetical protein